MSSQLRSLHQYSRLRVPSARGRWGFSIVELLVVIAIIIALLGSLLAALALAGRRAQATQTQFFMTSVSNALTAFETDIGYLPPLLGRPVTNSPTLSNARDLLAPPVWALQANGQPTTQSRDNLQNWYSYTALPEYLLGYGDRTQDGHGAYGPLPATPAGSPGSREPLGGIRSPGDDGVWGALLNPRANTAGGGILASRNIVQISGSYSAATVNPAVVQGKVFGPYLQVNDTATLGAIKGFDGQGEPIIVRAGEDPAFDTLPKVFLDYWGSPISYYRRPYPLADLRGREAAPTGLNAQARDLGDIFALRPFEFRVGEDLIGVADASGDNSTLARLKTAGYAIFSRGPDKAWDKSRRRDVENFNRDNIVEVGQ